MAAMSSRPPVTSTSATCTGGRRRPSAADPRRAGAARCRLPAHPHQGAERPGARLALCVPPHDRGGILMRRIARWTLRIVAGAVALLVLVVLGVTLAVHTGPGRAM